MANRETALYWIALHPRFSATGLLAAAKNTLVR